MKHHMRVGGQAGELHAERVGDGGAVADGRHGALVEVLERRRRGLPASRAAMTPATYLPSCMAGCATPGSLFSETMSPTAKISGCPGTEQSGSTGSRPARSTSTPTFSPSSRASGEACTPAAQIRGAGRDRLDAVRALDRDAVVVHVHGEGVEPDLDAHLLQRPLGVALQPGRERRQDGLRAFQQDDPGLVGVDRAVVPRQHGVGQLGDLPDELDTGGAGADHDEGQPVGAFLRVGRDLGHLELRQDPVAQVPGVLDGLHPGGELGEVVVAEVRVGRARGDDEGVVGQSERRGRPGPCACTTFCSTSMSWHLGQQRAHVGLAR